MLGNHSKLDICRSWEPLFIDKVVFGITMESPVNVLIKKNCKFGMNKYLIRDLINTAPGAEFKLCCVTYIKVNANIRNFIFQWSKIIKKFKAISLGILSETTLQFFHPSSRLCSHCHYFIHCFHGWWLASVRDFSCLSRKSWLYALREYNKFNIEILSITISLTRLMTSVEINFTSFHQPKMNVQDSSLSLSEHPE